MMKFDKTPPEVAALFEKILPKDPRVERRKMFGYPCAFVNKNMFCGTFGKSIMVRLSEERRGELMEKGWKQFEPMPGRPMKEYLLVPESALKGKEAPAVMKESLEYAAGLPPKKR
jgi:TfoX/Sxy family transcriptional regulator of competence genes